jgi:hypothetical protein
LGSTPASGGFATWSALSLERTLSAWLTRAQRLQTLRNAIKESQSTQAGEVEANLNAAELID